MTGSKYFVTQGGILVPGIVSYPALLKKGEINSPITFYDWTPTFSKLCGLKVKPADSKKWNGIDVTGLLKQPRTLNRTLIWEYSRYEPIEFSNSAVRQGDWKLVWKYRAGTNLKDKEDNADYIYGLTHEHQIKTITKDLPVFEVGAIEKPALYNLSDDPGEKTDLSDKYPVRVSKLTKIYQEWFKNAIKRCEIARKENIQ